MLNISNNSAKDLLGATKQDLGDSSSNNEGQSDEDNPYSINKSIKIKLDPKALRKILASGKSATYTKVIESDYDYGEDVQFGDDVYALFIAANMTKSCSPVNLIYTLR